jgi:hypothetical protein
VWAGLRRNLTGGLLLLTPNRLTPDRFVRSFDQVVLLLLLGLLLWAGLDRLGAEPDSQFTLDGLFGWASYLLMGLFGCALVARAQGSEADTRALLITTLSVAPFLLAALWLLGDVPLVGGHPLAWALVAIVFVALVGLRALRAAYGAVRPRAALLAVALIVLAPFAMDAVGLDTHLWVAEDSEQADDEDPAAAESLLYDQPARIAAAVDQIAPRQRGRPNAFFLGFAGVGDQSVFRREALYAQQVFAERFGTGERSVQLINDDADRDTYPLATVSGLEQATKLIAARMVTDEDVLVLMLTSHGSQDGLAVANGGLALRQLEPADLSQALDSAGIKWRVIIVSACYSGVFVDALKSDTTLVITAADAEHSSFGCDDSRDLTWFGEAFLRDALPGATSVESAFRKAAALIDTRETAAHETHSNPQIYIGERMREKLAALQSGPAAPADPHQRRGETRTASVTIPPCPPANRIAAAPPCRSQ